MKYLIEVLLCAAGYIVLLINYPRIMRALAWLDKKQDLDD